MAKVDIIIPVYNTEAYLERCLNSLINQTFKDFKIIAVNDGSTDNSLNILENYRKKLNMIIIDKLNEGVNIARKTALEKSDAKYVSFIDSDDCVSVNYLSDLLKNIEDNKSNVCSSTFAFHFNVPLLQKIGFKSMPRKECLINLEKEKEFLPSINVVNTGKIWKREYVNLPDKNFKVNEDLSTTHLNCAKAKNVSFSNAAVYHYLPNENGLVSTQLKGYKIENFLNVIEPLQYMKRGFEENNMFLTYYEEIEAIWINHLFQKVNDINYLVKDLNQKRNLMNCIINILDLEFPLWRENKYYQNNFRIKRLKRKTEKFYIRENKTKEELIKKYELFTK